MSNVTNHSKSIREVALEPDLVLGTMLPISDAILSS